MLQVQPGSVGTLGYGSTCAVAVAMAVSVAVAGCSSRDTPPRFRETTSAISHFCSIKRRMYASCTKMIYCFIDAAVFTATLHVKRTV